MWRWAGDTLAVHDYSAARISLFTGAGFARSIVLGEPTALVTAGLFGRLPDASLVLGTVKPVDYSKATASTVRHPQSLINWRVGSPDLQTIATDVPGLERYVAVINGRPGMVRANFGRSTSIGVAGSAVVIYDNALPQVKVLAADGKLLRVVRFDLKDPAVSAADRDSVLEAKSTKQGLASAPADVRALLVRFPPTKPNATWAGVDDGGFWLALKPTGGGSTPVHIRVDLSGRLTHCFRA